MKRLTVLFLCLFLCLALTAAPVHADVAPPEQPPGANPGPGNENTQVSMQSESVLIDVQAKTSTGSLGTALVTADFDMLNTGSQDESMDVRFPLSGNDGFDHYPEISDFRASVNGTAVSSQRTTGKDPFGFDNDVAWAAFPVKFPAGQVTHLRVTYSLAASGLAPDVWFYYILSTGAGWKDSIGSAELTVRLPYPVNNENFMGSSIAGRSATLAGAAISGNEVKWTYTHLEPTTANNFIFTLVQPSVWQQVLSDQEAVAQAPKDGEAWGRLGKMYKQLLFSPKQRGFRLDLLADDPGAQQLLELSKQAYAQAVSLKPKDPLWHAGYADLLGYSAYWAGLEGLNTNAVAVQALSEIRQALKLAPSDPTVNQIAQELTSYFPDGMISNGASYDYPWLTATPTAAAEIMLPQLSSTPAAAEAQTPAAPTLPVSVTEAAPTSTASGPAASKPLLPLCGSAFLLPVVGLLVWRRRR
jgi:Cytochrome c biogenesis factor